MPGGVLLPQSASDAADMSSRMVAGIMGRRQVAFGPLKREDTIMESRVDMATARHRRGYNCAQAVACTYCDLFGVDEKTMFRAAESLGLGMGGMEGTCGAVAGACMIAGLATSDGNLEAPRTKAKTYAISREIVKRFEEAAGATRCRDLKGIDTGAVLMPCPACVTTAAQILEDVVLSDKE